MLNPSAIIPRNNDAFKLPPRGGGQATGRTRVQAAAKAEGDSNEQTIATATLNLIKGCVGAGVLSLPAGVAAIGDVPTAYVFICSQTRDIVD